MQELSTQIKGRTTELEVINYFLKYGYIVSEPVVDTRYDLIAEINNKLVTIQIKTSHIDKNKNYIEFATCNIHINTNGTTRKNYKKDNVDYFATMYENKCYIIPVEDCGSRNKKLRLKPTKNNQIKNIAFAKNYEFEKIFPSD